MKYFISFLLLSACSFDIEQKIIIEKGLDVPIKVFFEQSKVRGVELQQINLIVKWGYIKDVGLFIPNSLNTIIINSCAKTFDSLALQYVVFHEMGHWMGRQHIQTFSIMNPNKYAGDYHNDFMKREKLIDELFKN